MNRCVFFSSLLLCCLISAVPAAETLRAVQCPDSFLITPCTCTLSNNLLDMTCSGLPDLKTLVDIFGRAYPTNEFHSLTITRSRLDSLPNDVFQGKSFEVIVFSNSVASYESTQIFLSSKNRLTDLTILQDNTDNWSFAFANLAGFNSLNRLEVSGYDGVLIGSLTNLPALTTLILRTEQMVSLPTLSSLPALDVLDFDGNTIQILPTDSFSTVPTIRALYLGHNKIATVGKGSISLTGPVDEIDLSANLISSFEADAISGLSASSALNLVGNYITQLPESVFQPIVDLLSQGSGQLFVDGNPLECGCDIAWIVTNPLYLDGVVQDGRCANGTKFANLNPSYYVDNC